LFEPCPIYDAIAALIGRFTPERYCDRPTKHQRWPAYAASCRTVRLQGPGMAGPTATAARLLVDHPGSLYITPSTEHRDRSMSLSLFRPARFVALTGGQVLQGDRLRGMVPELVIIGDASWFSAEELERLYEATAILFSHNDNPIYVLLG
jgi:hypothetical protein